MRFEDRFDKDGNALPRKVIVRRARRQRAAERRAAMRLRRTIRRREVQQRIERKAEEWALVLGPVGDTDIGP